VRRNNNFAALKNVKLEDIFIDNDGNVLEVNCEWNEVGYRFPVTAKNPADAARIYNDNDEEIRLYKDSLYWELYNADDRLSAVSNLSPYCYDSEDEVDDTEIGYIVDYHYDDQLSV
jgi:hypothetical protein